MRRPLLRLLVVVLAVPALALAAAGDPTKQINPVDQRKAASIVLKRTDFGAGWKKVPGGPDSGSGDSSCPGYNYDESDLILTGESEAHFEQPAGTSAALSFSSVYKTKGHAVASWSRSVTPAFARCAALTFKEGLEEKGAKVAIGRQGVFAFPRVAPRTAAFRIAMRVSLTQGGKTTTIPATVHLVVLGSGRGETTLIAMGLGNGIPTADLRLFAKATASRLAAAKL